MRAGQKNPKVRDRYNGLTSEEGRWNGQIRLREDNLDLPLRVKKPTVWAVWNDLFHEAVPDEFIWKAFNTMFNAQWIFGHTFMILTKRPERMKKIIDAIKNDLEEQAKPVKLPNGNTQYTLTFSFPPQRIWLGVTAENQEQADKRIPILLQIPAAVRFVSVEPMLGPVDLTSIQVDKYTTINFLEGCGITTKPGARGQSLPNAFSEKLDWVICGGESGPGARPMHPDWARSLRDQCQAAGVPFFFKQKGEWTWEGFEPYYSYGSDNGKWDDFICVNGECGSCKINDQEGTWINWAGNFDDSAKLIRRVGKKKAGRLLDGRTWDEMPVMP